MIIYCKRLKISKLFGHVVYKNGASAKNLERGCFSLITRFMIDDIKLLETKYEIYLGW
ncbi:MAG: hypothetical protein ACJAQ1_000772 [Flavobacterium sp.]|jgi:hypothetical protein